MKRYGADEEPRMHGRMFHRLLTCIRQVPLFVWGGVIVGLVWLLNLSLAMSDDGYGDRGTFGDAFGMANSLFAGVAGIGLLVTIWYQRQDMKRLDDQANRRDFEATFFELLRAIGDTRNGTIVHTRDGDLIMHETGFRYGIGDPPYVGMDAFDLLLHRVQSKFFSLRNTYATNPWNSMPDNHPFLQPKRDIYDRPTTRQHRTFISGYNSFYSANSQYVTGFYSSVYIILHHLDASVVNDKDFYAKILKSRLSEVEAQFLMMHYASQQASVEFNDLMDRYAMLESTSGNGLATHCLEFFNLEAFGNKQEAVKETLQRRAKDREINREPRS